MFLPPTVFWPLLVHHISVDTPQQCRAFSNVIKCTLVQTGGITTRMNHHTVPRDFTEFRIPGESNVFCKMCDHMAFVWRIGSFRGTAVDSRRLERIFATLSRSLKCTPPQALPCQCLFHGRTLGQCPADWYTNISGSCSPLYPTLVLS